VAPLSGLTGLRTLWLGVTLYAGTPQRVELGNPLTDVTPVASMTGMVSLGVSHLEADISPVASLVGLRYLTASGNDLTDIEFVRAMDGLEQLAITGNRVSDLSPLAGKSSLWRLVANENEIADVTALAGLPSLSDVKLRDNLIDGIAPLVGNVGIATGDIIEIEGNYLDLTPGSQDRDHIDTLLARGVNLTYEPQNAVNHPPIASAGSATTTQDTPVQITLTAIDPDEDSLSFIVVDEPANGSLSNVSGDEVTYTPSAGFTGVDSFAFKANDGQVDSAPASVAITINPSAIPHGAESPISLGTGVTVTAGQATVFFPAVSSPGTLTVTPYAPRHEGPANYRLIPNLYFDIHPTATFTGPATVTLAIPSDYTGDLTKLKIFHWKNNGWESISPTVDLGSRTLTFQADSFSDYGVGEPAAAVPVVSTPASSTWSLGIGACLALVLVALKSRRSAEG